MPSFSTDTSDLLPPSIPLKDRYNFNKNLPTFPPPEVAKLKINVYLINLNFMLTQFICPGSTQNIWLPERTNVASFSLCLSFLE